MCFLTAALAAIAVACGGRPEPPPVSPEPAPPGWNETKARVDALRYEDGKREEAIALMEAVVKAAPGFPNGHFELGVAVYEAASRDYGAPRDARAARFDQALGHFRQALALGYQPRGDVHWEIAQVHIRARRFADAEQEGRVWVSEQPDSPKAWWILASATVTLGRPADGVRIILDAGPKIGNDGQVEYAQYLSWTADLPPLAEADRKALIDAAQTVVDRELAAGRTGVELALVRANILKTTAAHLEKDPARQRALEDEAARLTQPQQ